MNPNQANQKLSYMLRRLIRQGENRVETTTFKSKITALPWRTVKKHRHLQWQPTGNHRPSERWQSTPWWPQRAIALPLPRSGCEPARRPWGWPAVEQVSTNEQPSWTEEQEWKKIYIYPTIPLSFLKRPHRKNKNSTIIQFSPPLLFPLPLPQFHLMWSCRAWRGADKRIQLQNEVMFTINTSAEGETAEELQPKLCWVQDVTPPNARPVSDRTILRVRGVCCSIGGS